MAHRDEIKTPYLLTVREAMLMLHVSRTTIYKLIKAHELPTVKVGSGTRIPLHGLEVYCTRHLT